ncbi:Hypothetical predicted protein [Mytilus galloprovincialis]|uniref:SAP domain-containing protein n=1 Tax=Mytilus galloprovincialis TaxID=29158 RepID=A0A8B6DPP4_MYTGA|nr:Hypothetical predicted protein [Mytilus galloprovincialis]
MDCTIDTIKVRKRIENLCNEMERERRNYVKKNDDWWEHYIRVTRAQKKENVSKEIQAADEKFHVPTVNSVTSSLSTDEVVDFEDLSVEEIKQKLLAFGIKTKLRKKEKLVVLLKETVGGRK